MPFQQVLEHYGVDLLVLGDENHWTLLAIAGYDAEDHDLRRVLGHRVELDLRAYQAHGKVRDVCICRFAC